MAQQKKEYQKPVLERLVLIPRENVLAACSITAVSGSGPWPNGACTVAPMCFSAGVMGPLLP
jgi:hypothetical protein